MENSAYLEATDPSLKMGLAQRHQIKNDPVLNALIFGVPVVEKIQAPNFDQMDKVKDDLKKLKHKPEVTVLLTSEEEEQLAIQELQLKVNQMNLHF